MNKNKIIIKDIINRLKQETNKIQYIKNVIAEYEDVFQNKRIKKNIFGSLNCYETFKDNQNEVTPEIFSYLEELSLSIENGQYESGSYYTNKFLIERTLKEMDNIYEKTIFDPAAGTGNFLISSILLIQKHLKTKNSFVEYICKYIYMNELHSNSIDIYLKRLNYISIDLYDMDLTKEDIINISKNCFNKDFLIDFNINIRFDIVIGNPPYLGTKSLGKTYLEKLNNQFGFTDDLYSLFIFKSFEYLKEDAFFSFVTSNTYFTLRTKEYIRKLMVDKGLYKLINNNKSHFNIMSNTSTFFIKTNQRKTDISVYIEDEDGILIKTNKLKKETIKNLDFKFSLKENNRSDLTELFDKSIKIYNENKDNISTSAKMKKFIETDVFKNIIKENDLLPLGLVCFIATGVDFKGNNKNILYSLDNKKFNLIEDKNKIKYELNYNDFNSGLKEHTYIKAIKGTEHLFVKWDKETFNYLKKIKAPLRNLSLYGQPVIYCKTSTYKLTKLDKNTLCINTAGACFIRPLIDISIDDIYSQINKEEIKDYIKNNINNSLCFTPNDLKLIPIRIRK